jgi:lipid-A-disaccharide synthase
MARDLDSLAVIFPFEPACYADTSLPVEFVGHPFLADDYAPPVRYDPAGPVLLLPGSRVQAVRRIFPSLLGAYETFDQRAAVVLYPSEEIRAVLEQATTTASSKSKIQLRPVGGEPLAASAVLTSSGTMSLHCALAGIPGAIAYRTNPLTYLMARWWVKIDYIGIANLLLKEPMYPEFIQGAATPKTLAGQLRECISDPRRRERTQAQASRLRELLHASTSGSAADWLLRHLP